MRLTYQIAEPGCRSAVMRCFAAGVVLVNLILMVGTAQAFEKLTEVQNLIYSTAHLANTESGQEIKYRYLGQSAATGTFEDRALLSIKKVHDDDKRDVVLDFLSDERRMAFPDFTGFKGNPIIISMLEHIAQTFGRETGGGVLYFRNRIRDALARQGMEVKAVEVDYRNQQIKARQVSFRPFLDDPYLAEKPNYLDAAFTLTFSDQVPGGVVGIAVKSNANSENRFQREIVIE